MEGNKKKKKIMQIKAETGGEKKYDRFAFVLRRQWVGSRFPPSKGLALFTEQEILSCSVLQSPHSLA